MNLVLLFILQLILIILLLIFLYGLFKESRVIDIEKRLSTYSIPSVDEQSIPMFEKLFKSIWKLIRKLDKLWEKSDLLNRYSKRFEKYINYKELDYKSGYDYLSVKFLVSLLFALIYIISGITQNNFNSYVLLLVIIVSYFIIDVYLMIDYKKRKKQIEHDLLNAIIIMNNAFKSGMNIMQAVEIVKEELSGPIQDEFKKISMDIDYGLSLEVVFDRFYKRVKIEDIKYITSSLSLINKTGGNIVRVFGSIEKNFYDKKKIKDEMDSLTSSSKFMFKLLIIMPIILCIIIFMLNPEFFTPLLTTSLGKIISLVIILLFSIYVFIVKRIMRVEV